MALRHLGHIDLPPSRSDDGFDHTDIHGPTDRHYVAHTSNDAIDVIDIAHLLGQPRSGDARRARPRLYQLRARFQYAV